jgi:hypothetical protein
MLANAKITRSESIGNLRRAPTPKPVVITVATRKYTMKSPTKRAGKDLFETKSFMDTSDSNIIVAQNIFPKITTPSSILPISPAAAKYCWR